MEIARKKKKKCKTTQEVHSFGNEWSSVSSSDSERSPCLNFRKLRKPKGCSRNYDKVPKSSNVPRVKTSPSKFDSDAHRPDSLKSRRRAPQHVQSDSDVLNYVEVPCQEKREKLPHSECKKKRGRGCLRSSRGEDEASPRGLKDGRREGEEGRREGEEGRREGEEGRREGEEGRKEGGRREYSIQYPKLTCCSPGSDQGDMRRRGSIKIPLSR